ncbi:MAG: Lar family restriction alleviation protein [Myxococcales bacterium]|jgi:hypothetical protein|nr:Lar family restriction alleviation protein [Myxococcales bacterium]
MKDTRQELERLRELAGRLTAVCHEILMEDAEVACIYNPAVELDELLDVLADRDMPELPLKMPPDPLHEALTALRAAPLNDEGLRECPFCGALGDVILHATRLGGFVMCDGCGAEGARGDTEDEAQRLWNGRALVLEVVGSPPTSDRDLTWHPIEVDRRSARIIIDGQSVPEGAWIEVRVDGRPLLVQLIEIDPPNGMPTCVCSLDALPEAGGFCPIAVSLYSGVFARLVHKAEGRRD